MLHPAAEITSIVDPTRRLAAQELDALARRAEAGGNLAPGEIKALLAMAREALESTPAPELVRLATLLVGSRGAAPLKSADYAALGAAVLKAARGPLLEQTHGAIGEARDALAYGRNWLETLERVRVGGRVGQQVVGLAGSMTKTLHRHLVGTAEALGFGMVGQLEALDPAEPGYREVPAFASLQRRATGGELEAAQESLRLARLGVLKIARFTYQLSGFSADRIWDEALASRAAASARDAAAHLDALAGDGARGD